MIGGLRYPIRRRPDAPRTRAQVTSQPYYAAEDIGIAGQGSCAHGGCFFGVMHYIYKARRLLRGCWRPQLPAHARADTQS
jgi:hypothetical protein